MFGLAQTFQRPMLVSKLAEHPQPQGGVSSSSWTSTIGSPPRHHHAQSTFWDIASSSDSPSSSGSSECGSPIGGGLVMGFLQRTDETERRASASNTRRRRSSVLDQVRQSLSYLFPDTFRSLTSTSNTDASSPGRKVSPPDAVADSVSNNASLFQSEFVFVRAYNRQAVEGPYRVVQRNRCMFKLDLVDHHIWVPVQLLEPCLNLSGGCEDQRASWSGKGSGGVVGQTDPSSEVVYDDSAETHRPIQRERWFRRSIRNRMTMPSSWKLTLNSTSSTATGNRQGLFRRALSSPFGYNRRYSQEMEPRDILRQVGQVDDTYLTAPAPLGKARFKKPKLFSAEQRDI